MRSRRREADAQPEPGRLVLERRLVEEVGAQRIEIEARRDFAAQEARLGEAQIELLALLAGRRAQAQELPAAAQIALGDRDVEQEAFGRRIARRERQFAGRLLFDRDRDHGTVRLRAVGIFDRDFLEEAERTGCAGASGRAARG